LNMYFALNLDYFALEYKNEPHSASTKLKWLAFIALLLQTFEMIQLKVEGIKGYFA